MIPSDVFLPGVCLPVLIPEKHLPATSSIGPVLLGGCTQLTTPSLEETLQKLTTLNYLAPWTRDMVMGHVTRYP